MKRDVTVNWNNRLEKIRKDVNEVNAASERVYKAAEIGSTAEVWLAVERFRRAVKQAERTFWGAVYAELD